MPDQHSRSPNSDGAAGGDAPQPQPEAHEPRLRDPGVTDLSRRDHIAVVKRTAKEFVSDQGPDMAAALAYYSFLALPSALLVVLGAVTLVLSPSDINSLMDKFSEVVPAEVTNLLGDSLKNLKGGGAGAVLGVGLVLALWSTTGAMTAFMRAMNRAYERKETRNFLRQRLVALAMVVAVTFSFVLVMGLLVLGPTLSSAIGEALDQKGLVQLVWWVAQWPILLGGLLASFATLLYLGPDVDHPRWSFLTPGARVAVVAWLVVSGLVSVYTSMFGSYNKTWGSLAAVIVMLTWLWLSSMALILGAEVNAEVERSRELRKGLPAEEDLQAPPQGEGDTDTERRSSTVEARRTNGHAEDLDNQSLAELFGRLSEQTRTLVRQELQLAKAEISEKGKRLGIGAGMLGAAALVGVAAFGAAVACIIAALSVVLATWLAALITTAGLGAIAGTLALVGKRRIAEATPPVPVETIESVKEDVEWLKTHARSNAR